MKIKGMDGEFGFKALVRDYGSVFSGWKLTDKYFFECPTSPSEQIKWPVEVLDDGSIYIPSEEELQEDK